MEKKEEFSVIWLRRTKEEIRGEIYRFKSYYTSAKLSYRFFTERKDKIRYSQYKAFYFIAIMLRQRLLRKGRISAGDIAMIKDILFKKYPFLSKKFLKKALKDNFLALKALEDNYRRGAEK